jgi:hypothetical protein
MNPMNQPLTEADLEAIRDRAPADVIRLLAEVDRLRSEAEAMKREKSDPLYWFHVANDMERNAVDAIAERDEARAEAARVEERLIKGRAVLTDRIAHWKAEQERWQSMPTSAMDSRDWLAVEFQQHRHGEAEDLLDKFDAATA